MQKKRLLAKLNNNYKIRQTQLIAYLSFTLNIITIITILILLTFI